MSQAEVFMGWFRRSDDHRWSQLHLSHYAAGDLSARARRRLERHAEDCVDCGRGIRAMRALLRLIPAIEGREIVRAPAGIFDRVRSGSAGKPGGGGAPAGGV
jgi:anti-sigma factor RsiW